MSKSTQIAEQKETRRKLSHLFASFKQSKCQIRPHLFLTGTSGSGKSYLVNEIADELGLGFVEINAAQLTVEGVSGNSLSKALVPLKNSGGRATIVFVDEFDKLLVGNTGDATYSRSGVQDEFLKCLESEHISIFGDYGKYVNIRADNLLFVFAGAFNNEEILSLEDLAERGLRNEFLGRVGVLISTIPISLETILAAIPQSSLLESYLELNPKITKKDAVKGIVEIVTPLHEKHALGMRLITTATHQYFMEQVL